MCEIPWHGRLYWDELGESCMLCIYSDGILGMCNCNPWFEGCAKECLVMEYIGEIKQMVGLENIDRA